MSRCFPYPPPGYTLSRGGKEALIESVKLQKEREKAKAQKTKEKRREKEDERKEKKEKRKGIRIKTNEGTDLNSKKIWEKEKGKEEKKERRDKKRKERYEKKIDLNSNKLDFPGEEIGKSTWANWELLERSDLTEEHDQPIHLPSTSSESTESSNKRKRQSSPIIGIRGHGTIIRIQLPPKKQNVSGRTDSPPLINQQQNFCASSEKTSCFDHGSFDRTGEQQILSTSGKSEPVAPVKTGTLPGPNAIKGCKKSSESIPYTNLIENWVPPSLQDTLFGLEDLDWLFHGNDHLERTEKRQKFENDSLFCSSSSSLWQPRAQLLPEVEVYALPFTVPY